MDLGQKGISAVIGAILLIGVTVTLAGSFAHFVTGQDPPGSKLRVQSVFEIRGDSLNLTHDGGSEIRNASETLEFKINGDVVENVSFKIGEDNDFGITDSIKINTDFNKDDEFVIVHKPSNSVLYQGTIPRGSVASLTADFAYSPASPISLDNIQFTDNSIDSDGSIWNWSWDFEDGTTSTEQNPSHKYSDDGTYEVKLTVTDESGGTDSVIKTITVSSVPPIADFAYSPVSPTTLDNIQFTDNSTDSDGSISSWSWDFGDGVTSTSENSAHSYDGTDNYTVTLEVTNDDGATDSVTKTITVRGLNYNEDAIVRDGPDKPNPEEPGGVEFSVTNTFDSTMTIDNITINPLNDNINELDDTLTEDDYSPELDRVEIYAGALSNENSYSDWATERGSIYKALAIPDEGVNVEVGFDGTNTNSGSYPKVNSGNDLTWYLHEFYTSPEDPDDYRNNRNINMVGEKVDITFDFTVGGNQGTKTIRINPKAPSEPPSADFTYSRITSFLVNLDAGESSDPDGTIVSYDWDIGNDGYINYFGGDVDWALVPEGTEVRLIVTDNSRLPDESVQIVN